MIISGLYLSFIIQILQIFVDIDGFIKYLKPSKLVCQIQRAYETLSSNVTHIIHYQSFSVWQDSNSGR